MNHLLSLRMLRTSGLAILLFTELAITASCGPHIIQGCGMANAARHSLPITVYIVRHAEKELSPALRDPALTPAGEARALALRDTMRHYSSQHGVVAVFSTKTVRTRSTARPLAEMWQLPIQAYDPQKLQSLVSIIRRGDYNGRAVLIVGHSNTILETVEAFGAKRPVAAIGDNEYSYLLEVEIPRDTTQAPTAVARRYGNK